MHVYKDNDFTCGAIKYIIRTTIIIAFLTKLGSLHIMMLDDTFSHCINDPGDRGLSFSAQ